MVLFFTDFPPYCLDSIAKSLKASYRPFCEILFLDIGKRIACSEFPSPEHKLRWIIERYRYKIEAYVNERRKLLVTECREDLGLNVLNPCNEKYFYFEIYAVIPDELPRPDVNVKLAELFLDRYMYELPVVLSKVFFVVHGMTIKPYLDFLKTYEDLLRKGKLGLAFPNFEMSILESNKIVTIKCARNVNKCFEYNIKLIKEIEEEFSYLPLIHILGVRLKVLKKLITSGILHKIFSIDSLATRLASKQTTRFEIQYHEGSKKLNKKVKGNYMITGSSTMIIHMWYVKDWLRDIDNKL